MSSELDGPFDRGRGGPGGWTILVEPEVRIDGNAFVPDVAGWRREPLPSLPQTAHFRIPPDWICEVLSPSTMRLDRTDKKQMYAQLDVRHCWLADPDARTLEVFALTDGKWLRVGANKDDEAVSAPPFDVHTFALDVLWPDHDTPPDADANEAGT